MSAESDVYHKLLGIPPHEQPPNCYRLLGVSLFEADPEIIAVAAARQISFLQQHLGDDEDATTQQVMQEVQAADACLRDSAQKAHYDAILQQQLDTPIPPPVPEGLRVVARPQPAAMRKNQEPPPPRVGGEVNPARLAQVRPASEITLPSHDRKRIKPKTLARPHVDPNPQHAAVANQPTSITPVAGVAKSNEPSRSQGYRSFPAMIIPAIGAVAVVAAIVGLLVATQGSNEEKLAATNLPAETVPDDPTITAETFFEEWPDDENNSTNPDVEETSAGDAPTTGQAGDADTQGEPTVDDGNEPEQGLPDGTNAPGEPPSTAGKTSDPAPQEEKRASPFQNVGGAFDLPMLSDWFAQGGHELQQATLAEIPLALPDKLQLNLLGEPTSNGESFRIFQVATSAEDSAQWEVTLHLPDGTMFKVARFTYDRQRLAFTWLSAAKKTPADHLRNCLLVLRADTDEVEVPLRAPLAVDPLRIDLTIAPDATIDRAVIPALPQPELLSAQVTTVHGYPGHRLFPGKDLDPNLPVQIVFARSNREVFGINLYCGTAGIDNVKFAAVAYLPGGSNPTPFKPVALAQELNRLLTEQQTIKAVVDAINGETNASISAVNRDKKKNKGQRKTALSQKRAQLTAPYNQRLAVVNSRIAQLRQVQSVVGPCRQSGVVHFRIYSRIAGRNVLLAASDL